MKEVDGCPSNTMWPGPRPSRMPSFTLIHRTVWPQYTNITNRQDRPTDGQRSDSIGRAVLQTVAPKKQQILKCSLLIQHTDASQSVSGVS